MKILVVINFLRYFFYFTIRPEINLGSVNSTLKYLTFLSQ